MQSPLRVAATGAAVLALSLAGIACSDEDGDGATTDEEVEQIDETVDSVGDRVDEEVDRGQEEVDGNDG